MAFANKVVNVDRLSALPHEIVLHILPISDLTRVGILSHRFRALYLSTPLLSFTEFPSESIRTSEKRLELMSSLDRFFSCRGQNKVQSFSLYWVCEYHFRETATQRCCSVEKSRIMPWIENAVNCNVEKLHVSFSTGRPISRGRDIEFPSCVCVYKSLRSLSVAMGRSTLKGSIFSTCCISNLVFLRLRNVTVEDEEGFCRWVSLYCRFLKELRLECVKGLEDINIESSSLKSFGVESIALHGLCHVKISGEKLENIDIHWVLNFEDLQPDSISFEISAPNL